MVTALELHTVSVSYYFYSCRFYCVLEIKTFQKHPICKPDNPELPLMAVTGALDIRKSLSINLSLTHQSTRSMCYTNESHYSLNGNSRSLYINSMPRYRPACRLYVSLLNSYMWLNAFYTYVACHNIIESIKLIGTLYTVRGAWNTRGTRNFFPTPIARTPTTDRSCPIAAASWTLATESVEEMRGVKRYRWQLSSFRRLQRQFAPIYHSDADDDLGCSIELYAVWHLQRHSAQ
jgi:hypothetical protein